MKQFVSFLFIFILVSSCAKQGMPPGGPVDKTAPSVLETTPASGELGVSQDSKIEICFSESVQSKNIHEAVFITPYPGERVKVELKGRRVCIRFDEPLISDKTYVITLGTSIADLRNNAMEESFTLAFSTGDKIDRCSASGRIYGEKDATGIDIWAYDIAIGADPMMADPEYIVQCAKNGSFTMTHMSPATYRLFAVHDRFKDRRYQPVEDRFGLTFFDADLQDTLHCVRDGFLFRLTGEDTLQPALTRVDQLASDIIRLGFNMPVSLDDSCSHSVKIIDVDNPEKLVVIYSAFVVPYAQDRVMVLTDSIIAGRNYLADASALYSSMGTAMDTSASVIPFTAESRIDTVAPRLQAIYPLPASKGIPLTSSFIFNFNEPVDTTKIAANICMADTMGNPVQLHTQWNTSMQLSLIPLASLPSKTLLQTHLSRDWMIDLAGNGLADTLLYWTTLNKDTLSEISGYIYDADSLRRGAIQIMAKSADKHETSYSQWIEAPGAYKLSDVLPGIYVLSCYRDRDGNREYSHGKIKPYMPAERFLVGSDTVKVRARWPNEGNDLKLH